MIHEPVEISFQQIVKDVLEILEGPIREKNVTIELEDIDVTVKCDQIRILEVIQNLVDNAIKFMGDQPNPSIRIGTSGVDEKSGFPIFYVADNGIGIDPKYHDTVFGLFNRLDQQKDGTGIGLTLVKRIIEVHGGRIWLESEGQGKGSTFYFTLPSAE